MKGLNKELTIHVGPDGRPRLGEMLDLLKCQEESNAVAVEVEKLRNKVVRVHFAYEYEIVEEA